MSDAVVEPTKPEPTPAPTPEPTALTAPTPEPVIPVGAPEEYADFTLPEGFDAAQLDAKSIKDFAKELNLPQEAAQKLVDRVIKQRGDFETAQATVRTDTIKGWADAAKADKEIGGEKFEANLAAARSVIDNPALVAPEFKAFLDESGLGNHPEMIRTFVRLAPHFQQDKPVPGGGGKAPAGDPLGGMYNHPSSQHKG